MARLGINSCKQDELLALLFDRSLVQQQDSRQVGGPPPTGLTQALPKLLEPVPHRDVPPLDADPAKNPRDLPETHPELVYQYRQLDDLAIRSLPLKKLNLVQHVCEFGKVHSRSAPVGAESSHPFR